MLAYHGTSARRARVIFREGFLPLPPSRRVWFAESRAYALGRARTQARRTEDRPVVLACELDLTRFRQRLGRRRVAYRRGIIAVDGPVPARVLRDNPLADLPTTPEEVIEWVDSLFGLAPEQGVRRNHPGAARLSRGINRRVVNRPDERLQASEVVEMGRRWLPEFFVGADLTPRRLSKHRRVGLVDYEVDARASEPDPREAEAMGCLDDAHAAARVRGLELLAELRDPDLFDWCAMFLDDPAVSVRIAALRVIAESGDGTAEIVEPLVHSENRRIRAAALAALIAHAADDEAPHWIERGLKDPCACVRVAAARSLRHLPLADHRELFALARHDPNPDVAHAAEVGIGHTRRTRRRDARPARGAR